MMKCFSPVSAPFQVPSVYMSLSAHCYREICTKVVGGGGTIGKKYGCSVGRTSNVKIPTNLKPPTNMEIVFHIICKNQRQM